MTLGNFFGRSREVWSQREIALDTWRARDRQWLLGKHIQGGSLQWPLVKGPPKCFVIQDRRTAVLMR